MTKIRDDTVCIEGVGGTKVVAILDSIPGVSLKQQLQDFVEQQENTEKETEDKERNND